MVSAARRGGAISTLAAFGIWVAWDEMRVTVLPVIVVHVIIKVKWIDVVQMNGKRTQQRLLKRRKPAVTRFVIIVVPLEHALLYL